MSVVVCLHRKTFPITHILVDIFCLLPTRIDTELCLPTVKNKNGVCGNKAPPSCPFLSPGKTVANITHHSDRT